MTWLLRGKASESGASNHLSPVPRRVAGKVSEGALFCPAPKMKEAPSFKGAFLVSAIPPPRNHTGAGYFKGRGMCSRNMTIPRQLTLGEGNGQIKGKAQPKPRPVSPGRPRREVDVELLRTLRAKGYGYKRTAGEYTRVTGEYISHTTVRVRLVNG